LSGNFNKATKSPKHQRTPNADYQGKNIDMIWRFDALVVRETQW
jgi:hypothetical protein